MVRWPLTSAIMGINHCFQSGTVVPDLSSTDKESALRELVRRAPVFRELPDLERFAEAVIQRERQLTTGFGHGVAVAHGRVSQAGRVLIGLGLSREGIPFDAPDEAPVHLLFFWDSPSLDPWVTVSDAKGAPVGEYQLGRANRVVLGRPGRYVLMLAARKGEGHWFCVVLGSREWDTLR